MNLQRLTLTASGLGCGAYCAFAAFKFNAAMRPDGDGIVFGGVMALLTVGCWALLPIAVEKWREGSELSGAAWASGWAVIMALVLANSAGFTAGGRREVVTGKSVAIEAFTRAQQAQKAASEGLKEAMAAGRWKEVDRFRASIESAEAVLAKGKPGASDAQADMLSMMTGVNVETVQTVLPIATTVILEFAANILLLAAAMTKSTPSAPAPVPPPVQAVEPEKEQPRLPRERPHLVVTNEPEQPIDPAMTRAMAAIRSRMAKLS